MLVGGEDKQDSDVLVAFIKQYYSRAAFIPREVLLPVDLPEGQLVTQWLSDLKGGKVALDVPRRGSKKDLVTMAAGNAMTQLERARTSQAPGGRTQWWCFS